VTGQPTVLCAPHPFPVARWLALAWLVFFLPYNWKAHGPWNLLFLCDVAVILSCIGIWRGSALLLSSQALFSLLVQGAWTLDLLLLLHRGRGLWRGPTLISGWMLNPEIPLFFRGVSLYHAVWPFLLIWCVWRVGYDRRALWLQSIISAVVVSASLLAPSELNLNGAHDLFGRSWQPAALHVGIVVGGLIALAYLPTHVVLSRWLSPPRNAGASRGR
jgi:hypothetical protein